MSNDKFKPEVEEVKCDEVVHRAFTGTVVKSINKEQREIEFIISTERVDRYGDIVTLKGWDLREYRKNPIVLYGHNSRGLPIGRATKVWKDSVALRANAKFMEEDISPFAQTIFRMYEEKYLRAVSVGFMPVNWEFIKDDDDEWITGIKFTKQELLEFSCVPIPANPDALLDARSKGINVDPIRDWAARNLDEWKDVGNQFQKLYGVDKPGLELLRRKAAGTGISIHLDPTAQEELRKKNLESIKNKDKTVEENIEEDDEDEVLFDEEELAKFNDIIENAEILEESEDFKEILITEEKINNDTTYKIENRPKKILVNEKWLESLDNIKGCSVVIDSDKLNLNLSDDNLILNYDFLGRTNKDDEALKLVFELASEEIKENKTADDDDAEDEVDEEIENDDEDDEEVKEDDVESKTGDEVEDEVIEEDENGNDEENDDEEEDDKETSDTKMTDAEKILVGLELILDKEKSSGKTFSSHELRKQKFLASMLRDIAQKLDPIDTNKEIISITNKNEDDNENSGVTLEEVKDFLNEKIVPAVKVIVGKELNNVRGKLD